jgi:hypothetical protein
MEKIESHLQREAAQRDHLIVFLPGVTLEELKAKFPQWKIVLLSHPVFKSTFKFEFNQSYSSYSSSSS